MIIDAHTHVFETLHGMTGRGYVNPIGYGQIRFDTGQTAYVMPPMHEETRFTAEMLLRFMDWVGVDMAFIMQHSFHGANIDYLAGCIRRWPDRFRGACSFDPYASQWRTILKRYHEEMGFQCMKLELSVGAGLLGFHPDLKLNEPRLMEIWQQLAEWNMTLILDLGSVGEPANQKKEILEVMETFPNLRLSIPHLCYPPLSCPPSDPKWTAWEDMLKLGCHPRIYHDISFGGLLPDDEEYPFARYQDVVKKAVETCGAEKLIWGTDVTGFLSKATYRQGLDWVRRHCAFLSDSQKGMIMGETVRRVYHFEA